MRNVGGSRSVETGIILNTWQSHQNLRRCGQERHQPRRRHPVSISRRVAAAGYTAENLALMRRIDELFLKYPLQSEPVRQSREGEGIGRARAD